MWEFVKVLFGLIGREFVRTTDSNKWPQYDVDESGFLEITIAGEKKKHLWADVQHVGILTTSGGPWFEDVFFIVKSDQGDLCITHERATQMDLLKRFERLPGFKWGQVVEAMSCTSDESFACWDRSWQVPDSADYSRVV